MSGRRFLRLVFIVAAAAAVAAMVVTMRQRREEVINVTDAIENQLAELDPAARAAVLGRLAKDTAGEVHDQFS
jgi:hypothetical protein